MKEPVQMPLQASACEIEKITLPQIVSIKQASEIMKLTAQELFQAGLVDGVIAEGDRCFSDIARMLEKELGILGRMKSKELVNSRYDKFRNIDRGEIK